MMYWEHAHWPLCPDPSSVIVVSSYLSFTWGAQLTCFLVFFRRRFIEISKILYRIVENKDIREYNMIETKAGARVNIDC